MLIHPNPRPDPVSYSVIEFTELWSLTIFKNNRDAFEASDFEQAFFKISYISARKSTDQEQVSYLCSKAYFVSFFILPIQRASHSTDSGLYFSQLPLILKDLIRLW